MKTLSLGDRMKEYYENPYRYIIPKRLPVVLRLDGKAFHTVTKKLNKPFDATFIEIMNKVTLYLCEHIQGACFAYTQSDEISILIYPWKAKDSESWFNNNLQKYVSVSASMAGSVFTYEFNKAFPDNPQKYFAFDSRVFILPSFEVPNYFIWRQQDWKRNSILMLAQSLYSHKQMHGKKCDELLYLMKMEKDVNWWNLDKHLLFGSFFAKLNTSFSKITPFDIREFNTFFEPFLVEEEEEAKVRSRIANERINTVTTISESINTEHNNTNGTN